MACAASSIPVPIELGRDAAVMKEISEKSGMHIICTTGFYFEAMGLPVYWRARTVDEIAELYIREITHGIGDTGIKAGAIKVATGAPVVTEMEKKFLAAACIAQKATGVPIITHTQDGYAGPEQQELFAEGRRRAAQMPDRPLLRQRRSRPTTASVVDGGSYIGFDRIGLTRFMPDEVRADNLATLVKDGYRAQIMMSQDRHCGWIGKFAAPDQRRGTGAHGRAQGQGRMAAALYLSCSPILFRCCTARRQSGGYRRHA